MLSNVGMRFGKWTITREPGTRMYTSDVGAICKCDCGTERLVSIRRLKKGYTKSCGCAGVAKAAIKNRTHGQHQHRIHGIWRSMKERCSNKNHDAYARYGGRGIKVCRRWLKFENFLLDNGPLFKEGLTLDRIDNDGNYTKSNCQWVSRGDQANNRHNNVILEHDGERMTCSQWARKLGMQEITLRKRIRAGWSHSRAITTPVRPYYPG